MKNYFTSTSVSPVSERKAVYLNIAAYYSLIVGMIFFVYVVIRWHTRAINPIFLMSNAPNLIDFIFGLFGIWLGYALLIITLNIAEGPRISGNIWDRIGDFISAVSFSLIYSWGTLSLLLPWPGFNVGVIIWVMFPVLMTVLLMIDHCFFKKRK